MMKQVANHSVMSRSKAYQRLLNSKRWLEVKRIVWQRANGLCEQCLEEGIITGSLQSTLDCHHVIPVETAQTQHDMERLCFDPDNVRLLCVAHHIKVHAEQRSHSRDTHQDRAKQDIDRWLDQVRGKLKDGSEAIDK